MFYIGVLHAALAGNTAHALYARCGLHEVHAKGYDYWALGHVSEHRVWQGPSTVVLPGNLQGRHIRETEAEGVVLASVDSIGLRTFVEALCSALAEPLRAPPIVRGLAQVIPLFEPIAGPPGSAENSSVSRRLAPLVRDSHVCRLKQRCKQTSVQFSHGLLCLRSHIWKLRHQEIHKLGIRPVLEVRYQGPRRRM